MVIKNREFVKINAVSSNTYLKLKIKRANSSYSYQLVTLFEAINNYKHELRQQRLSKSNYFFIWYLYGDLLEINHQESMTGNVLLKDLNYFNKSWRGVRGYPVHGQRTHTNATMCKKNKLLVNFRLTQFYSLFGYRKRNIYPTLIVAEYVNRLWLANWHFEWLESSYYAESMVNFNKHTMPFDPAKLAKNQTNGYTREGKAAKMGKAKKLTNVVTIGVPVFFTRFMYYERLPESFPYRLWVSDESRRKMGVKRKKNKKKK